MDDTPKDNSDYYFYLSILLLLFLVFTQVSKHMETKN
jgi:hypothetical protein